MERADKVNKVNLALHECLTAKRESLRDHFTSAEILDFANTVVAYLPPTYEELFTVLDYNIFDIFADKKDDVLVSNIERLLKQVHKTLGYNTDDDKEQKSLNHLLFFILMRLRGKYNQNTDETLDSIINYYNSLLIPTEQLKETVATIDAPLSVSYYNDQGAYIRINEYDYSFVPSLTTKQNFNFLIPN